MFKYLPAPVARKVAVATLKTQKHSPTILFTAGLVGMGATVVTACRSTLRIEGVLDEIKSSADQAKEVRELVQRPGYTGKRYDDKDLKHDLTVIYIQGAVKMAKLYGPAFVLGVTSVFCLTKSHQILTSRNAGLAAAYAAVSKSLNEYRSRVVEDQGADKDREYMQGKEVSTEVVEDKNGPKKVKRSHFGDGISPYGKLFHEQNANWSPTPEYNVMFLRGQQKYANQRLHANGYLFLNDVYDELGLERTKAGQIVGWVLNNKNGGDNYVDFGIFNDDSLNRFYDYVTGREGEIMLDFNVDGNILDLI